MAQIRITLTDDFKEVVGKYQKDHKLKSWTQALLHLAALGYEQETNEDAPEPYSGWGGWRGSEESLEALEQSRKQHGINAENLRKAIEAEKLAKSKNNSRQHDKKFDKEYRHYLQEAADQGDDSAQELLDMDEGDLDHEFLESIEDED